MKNTPLSKSILLSMMLCLFFLLPSAAKAQFPCGSTGDIKNYTNCTINVKWEYYCGSSVCASASGVILSPGTTMTIPACGSGCINCNFSVTLVAVGGTGVGLMVDKNTTVQSWPPSICPSSMGNLSWSGGAVTIN